MTNHAKLSPARLPDPQMRKPGDLRPALRNARSHSRKQVRQIADSIRAFGFTNPVLVDRGGQVIAGHGRLAAAQLLGRVGVPDVRVELVAFRREAVRAGIVPQVGAVAAIAPEFDIVDVRPLALAKHSHQLTSDRRYPIVTVNEAS